MDLHDYLNVRRVLRTMAAQQGIPVFVVKMTIRRAIDEAWEKSRSDPEAVATWDRYFPQGKPTPEQYILRLGYAHENGEDVPYMLH